MNDAPDAKLLEQFTRNQSEAAFGELVMRHIRLVYSVAFRKTGNPQLAEDITQAVFIILARKADSLGSKTVLPGWLYHTARLTAANAHRAELRRIRREQEAFMQSVDNECAPDPFWRELSPLLEDAMAGLGTSDRDTLVLRYFQNLSLAEVGAALGTTECVAQRRVSRALEKLRRFFSRRGVNSTTAIIAGALSSNSLQAAPPALARTVTVAALGKGATASTSILTILKGALKVMAWTKAKTAVAIGMGALLVAGTATITVKEVAAQTATVAINQTAAKENEAWHERWDPSVLDRLPPQVKILPSLPSTVQAHIELSTAGPRGLFALGQSVLDLLRRAYGVPWDHLILDAPLPGGKYDVIANLPSTGTADPSGLSEDNRKALQDKIQQKFGLTGKRETIETNVLIVTTESRHGPGLRHPAGGKHYNAGTGYFSAHGFAIPTLLRYLNQHLGVIMIDQTGLDGAFDIDFKWDKTPEGLKQALRDQVGLELVATNMSVEIIVVKKSE